MPHPSHRRQRFIAQRRFTDRDDYLRTFKEALERPQSPDDYRVLVYYGVGGQGKTALCHELRKVLGASEDQRYGWAHINFDTPRYRISDEALISIRLQLRKTAGLRFPAFDTAFSRYFALAYPGADIRAKHPELFRGGNEVIENIADLGGTAMELTGLGLIYKYGTRISGWFWDWFQRRGRVVLDGLDELEPYELLEALPKYLGADVYDALAGEHPDETTPAKQRFVVLFDTYEALWRDRGLKSGPGALRVDAWVRRLVEEMPGVLFVIFGRDRLKWDELGDDWAAALAQHMLGGLSEEDAQAFLKAIPIPEEPVRQAIIAGARGLPFYLDLQVDQYEELKNKGQTPSAEDFGGEESEIIARFLDHLDREDQAALKLLAHARVFDEPLCRHLSERFLGGPATVDFAHLTGRSFIERNPEGQFLMHALMRDYLVAGTQREEPELARQIHVCLFAWYDRLIQVDSPRDISSIHELALTEAGYHLSEFDPARLPSWCDERSSVFYEAGRYALLEPLFQIALATSERISGPEHPDTSTSLNNLAVLYSAQGRYAEAEPHYQRALTLCEKALGPEHPETAQRVNNLAVLYNCQGRYDEAESLLIRALNIREHTLGPEHTDTALSLNSLAGLYLDQKRYSQAEPLYRRALAIREKSLGQTHPRTALSLNGLAVLYHTQKRYGQAELLYRRALSIYEQALGPEQPDSATATSLNNLAGLYRDQGRYDEAEPLYQRALAIFEKTVGPEHPNTRKAREDYELLLSAMGQ